MNIPIEIAIPKDFLEIVEVWEASVRATHYFLPEADIQFFKPKILNEYLPLVDLFCVRAENGHIIGFLGVAEAKIEMLFIHPNYRGQGIGRLLTKYAIDTLKTDKVDVNEQNPQAVGFYEKLGFVVIHRNEWDGLGKPYPILEMGLRKS